MPEKLNPGDVVQLNSGGPKMTIRDIGPDGNITCKWFSADVVKEAYFLATELILIRPKQESNN